MYGLHLHVVIFSYLFDGSSLIFLMSLHQVQLDRAEWGSDLPGVESHIENHKNVHKAIEEFESSLKEAKISEV